MICIQTRFSAVTPGPRTAAPSTTPIPLSQSQVCKKKNKAVRNGSAHATHSRFAQNSVMKRSSRIWNQRASPVLRTPPGAFIKFLQKEFT